MENQEKVTATPVLSFEERLAALRPSVPFGSHAHDLQRMAAAVADELDLRQQVRRAMRREAEQVASETARTLKNKAFAALGVESPMESTWLRNNPDYATAEDWHTDPTRRAELTRLTLRMMIKEGVLPADASELPDAAAQLQLLAPRQLADVDAGTVRFRRFAWDG